MTERSPEASVLAEKTARAIAHLDQQQSEIHRAIEMLDPAERDAVASDIKSSLQIALASRLCQMTIGGMSMSWEQVNSVALDLLENLNQLGDQLRKEKAN